MMRELGFYWVKRNETWIVAEWIEYFWLMMGDSYGAYDDTDFEEIDERRLIHN